jgi:hypothetical protein
LIIFKPREYGFHLKTVLFLYCQQMYFISVVWACYNYLKNELHLSPVVRRYEIQMASLPDDTEVSKVSLCFIYVVFELAVIEIHGSCLTASNSVAGGVFPSY